MRVLHVTEQDRDRSLLLHEQGLLWIDEANEPILALERVYPAGFKVPRHVHKRAQLWFARRGIVLVSTDDRRWMLPADHALFIPAGVAHAIEVVTDVEMHSIYVADAADRPRVLQVTPLGRSLIAELVRGDWQPERRRRLELVSELLLDELAQFPERPLGLPFPADARLAKLCRQFLSAPRANAGIDDWARALGIGRRTFTRLFRAQTGVSFVTWRQQACLFAALPRLAAGEPVTTVALDAGYENIAAFSTMFRRVLGRSPRSYLNMPEA